MNRVLNRIIIGLGLFLPSLICFSQNVSNRGREFWVGYGHHQFMEQGNNDMNMVIYLSAEDQPATVTVTIDSTGNPFLPAGSPGGPWQRVYTLLPYQVRETVNIPKGNFPSAIPSGTDPNYDARLYTDAPPAGTGGAGVFRKKGIHIQSNVPITAYAHIYGSASSGATMLMPVTAWGYSYMSLNSNQSYGSDCYSWMYVVASKDNTVIEVTPTVKTRAQNLTGLAPNVTKQVTLMKGQIYQVIGANLASDANGNGGTNGAGFPLSGTKVKSVAGANGECYPIAVFAGSSRTANIASCGSGGGDNDNQQLFPQHAWGRKYLTAPFSVSSSASTFQTSIFKIAVSDATTQVRKNGTLMTGLSNGHYTYESNTADYIEADKPVMVTQFMTGGTCMGGGGNVGDPEMVVVAPVEQAIKQVGFYRQSRQGIGFNYLTLVVPTEGVASLRIDNSGVFDHTYPHPRNAIIGKNYTVVVKRWTIAPGQGFQSLVSCDSAFDAITYGLGSVESYAYSAGAHVNNLNSLTSLHNQPDTANNNGNVHPYTGVNTPMNISILIRYKPTKLVWKFPELIPAGCWTSDPSISGDYVMDPASTYLVDSPMINGIKYYRYTLPHTFKFTCAGIYDLPVEAYSPGIDNCGNKETFSVTIEVKAKPVVDWTYQHPTRCSKDTVYLQGPTAGLSGLDPMNITQWNWVLPGGVISVKKDTAVVLPPGTHNIAMVAITEHGLLSDSVKKNITIYAPPTTVLTAVPTVVCLGQSITFSQTPAYGGAPGVPINNYYWEFGDNTTLNNLVTPQTHTYLTANSYIARAAVRVSELCVSDTVSVVVTVAPEAKIDFAFPSTCLPSTGVAQFNAPATDLGGTPIASYSWNFGDPGSGANNTSALQNPTHTYASFGTYPVTLSITTNSGCAGDSTINLTFGVRPALNYPALPAVCSNAAPLSVATATVTNGVTGTGTYSGPGTNAAGMFDPTAAGPGTHTITYTFVAPSCTETITQTITVNAQPLVNAGTYAPVCTNATVFALNGSPVGGTFSGPGVTGTSFNPATAGAGTHTITYSYTDANSCSNSSTTSITVNALPVVSAGTYAPVCANAAVIALNGSPVGGTFSGPGVTGNNFDPAIAGVGTHTITYIFTNASGCTSSATTTITVNALPVVNAGTYAPVCISAATIALNGTPAGGTFSGTGVAGTNFNPAVAGAGTHTVTYTYTNAGGCTSSATTSITVNALPVVNAGTYAPVCINATAIALNGTPVGGTFSGPGVTGTSFNPATAGAGTHTITYNYTDANGCSNSTTTTITVNALPVVNAGTYTPVCINAAAVALNGTPVGGTFSGPGVTGTNFNPATAGAGTHTITYNYADANGCSNSTTTSITVNALPVVNAGTYTPVCINATAIALNGTPAGGTFSGPGVTGTSFNPATAGAGTHTITYSYTNAGGCTSSATASITVNALPVVNAGVYAPVCINAVAITLNGTPAGGTFSGAGVTGNSFNPATAGAGTHAITYNYTDANGCSNSATASITVNALPVVNAGTYGQACISGAPITLNGTPVGGTFSGPGVTGNSFNPATAGAGTHTITYSYTDANGCNNSAITTITVSVAPLLDAGTYAPVCINGASVTLAGTPAGGTFTGPGVTGNSFNPSVAGAGTHTITYGNVGGGCTGSSATTTIVVNALPVVNAGTYTPVCINAAAITLNGTPAGGTFSGPGVTGNSFNPATAGAGTHTITYSYTDANGCANSGTSTIIVDALPVVNAGTYAPICINAATITLNGTPAAGTFSGPGITGNTFNPATAGVGTHIITYVYTNANGCSNSATTSVTVNTLPAVNAGTYAPVCVNAAVVALNGTPAGGTFSGPGITGGNFNPATAGVGTHTITYNYTDAGGCSNSGTASITVNALPVVNAGTYTPVCINGAAVTLAGTPAGGTFSGPGVTGNSFNPATAGAGTHTITYNYTNANGCTNSATTTITVDALPVVNAGTYTPVCINAAAITLGGTPAGGTFSGPGVTGNTFNPATAGVGTHTITYVYTNANGCSNTTTTSITVNALPVVNAGTYAPVCVEASPITLVGTPAGGTFSGPGVTGNSFNPATAGPGIHSITYSYTSAAGCTQSNSGNIRVHPRPVSSFTVTNDICLNQTSTITSTATIASGSITTWNWNLGNGNTPSNNNGNPFTASYPNATAYTVTLVTISDNGCVSLPATQTVNVHPLPVADFNVPTNICMPGGSATFTNRTTVPDNSALTYQWNFGDGLGTSTATNPSYVYGATGAYNVTLTATSAFGCTNTSAPKLVDDFYGKPTALFFVTPSELCQGQNITFNNQSADPNSTIQSWNWTFSDGTTATGQTPVKQFTVPGNHSISLTVTNAAGCVSDPYSRPVTVHLQPVVDAGRSFVVPQGTSIQFEASANSSSLTFSWSPAAGLSDPSSLRPRMVATGDQMYKLTATGDFGCTSTDSLTVKVLKAIRVPNVFSPNGDGIHDKWNIPNLADYPGCKVEVFNRYGQLVFSSSGYGTPWDGTYKGKDLPVGAYYYVIILENGFAPLNGSVTILR
jgi:gliding motility-associated-like protein